MSLWVISGCSKWDGLLYIVEAKTETDALQYVAKDMGDKIFHVEHEESEYIILADEDTTEQQLIESLELKSYKFWILMVSDVKIGQNHPEVVQW